VYSHQLGIAIGPLEDHGEELTCVELVLDGKHDRKPHEAIDERWPGGGGGGRRAR